MSVSPLVPGLPPSPNQCDEDHVSASVRAAGDQAASSLIHVHTSVWLIDLRPDDR